MTQFMLVEIPERRTRPISSEPSPQITARPSADRTSDTQCRSLFQHLLRAAMVLPTVICWTNLILAALRCIGA